MSWARRLTPSLLLLLRPALRQSWRSVSQGRLGWGARGEKTQTGVLSPEAGSRSWALAWGGAVSGPVLSAFCARCQNGRFWPQKQTARSRAQPWLLPARGCPCGRWRCRAAPQLGWGFIAAAAERDWALPGSSQSSRSGVTVLSDLMLHGRPSRRRWRYRAARIPERSPALGCAARAPGMAPLAWVPVPGRRLGC